MLKFLVIRETYVILYIVKNLKDKNNEKIFRYLLWLQ